MRSVLEATPLDKECEERFAAAIARHLGLAWETSRIDLLRQTLEERAAARGLAPVNYLDLLERGPMPGLRDELGELGAALTVPETYFFRNVEQLRAFQDLCLPLDRPPRDLRILSAGCASGEEAYSLAIAVLERCPNAGPEIASVLGVDLNPRMLARARAGRYSRWAVRDTSEEVLERWFHREGTDRVIDAQVRSLVTFEQRNLVDEGTRFPAQGFDVIFFRNVLMYFTAPKARLAIEALTHALRPGGLLFLGYAETMRNLSQDFELRHTHDTFYYELRGLAERRKLPRLAATENSPPSLRDTGTGGSSWVDAIRKASERVEVLTRAVERPGPSAAVSKPTAAAPHDLTSVLALTREERFQEALELIAAFPDPARSDPDVLQLTATLLVNAGRRTEAEDVAAELLRLDDLNVGAHYILALCSEQAGECNTAARHNRSAIHLDPSFSMAHVHLGILAKRANRRDEAKREFARALELLEREDTSRLLLFGGGFGRGALLAFCRNEMATCGEAA